MGHPGAIDQVTGEQDLGQHRSKLRSTPLAERGRRLVPDRLPHDAPVLSMAMALNGIDLPSDLGPHGSPRAPL